MSSLENCCSASGASRRDIEVLRAEIDASGYDLVLECNGVLRYVQFKSSYRTATTRDVQGRTLRRVGAAGAVFRRAAGRVQIVVEVPFSSLTTMGRVRPSGRMHVPPWTGLTPAVPRLRLSKRQLDTIRGSPLIVEKWMNLFIERRHDEIASKHLMRCLEKFA